MKKLMIAFSVIAIGFAANAASSLGWGSWGYINDGTDYEHDWITGGQAYLIMLDAAATDISVADDLTITGGHIVSSAGLEGGTVAGTWDGAENVLTAGNDYQFAILFTTAGTGAKNEDGYIMPTTGFYGLDKNGDTGTPLYTVTWDANGAAFSADEGSFAGVAMNTAVAPEPTSGLLLLLGVAGLALRRRRA